VSIWLIQGMFFQNQQRLDVRYIDFEQQAVVVTQLVRDMYTGAFGADPDNPEKMVGAMNDGYGESALMDVRLTNEELSFVKQYNGRPDKILYVFKKCGRVWHGGWRMKENGKEIDHGESNCTLTIVGETFFQPNGEVETINT
jgi:hypothetical protein